MKPINILISLLTLTLLTSCFNLPTQEAEISPALVSDVSYLRMTKSELAAELDSLTRRETQLKTAQIQRRKSSKVQAFWLGFGSGDGIEASELSLVRGQREAVLRAMAKKGYN